MPDRRRKLWSAGLDRSRVTAILGEVQRRHGSVLDRWKPPQQGAVGHILGLAGPDGVPMVLKVHRDVDRAATEATALRLVADVAHLPAPRLVDAGPDWVLMSRFLGRRWADRRDQLDETQNFELAARLWATVARAHSVGSSSDSYGALGAAYEPGAEARGTSLHRRAQTIMSDLTDGGAADRLVRRIEAWLTERLSTRMSAVTPVLCHRDLTGGNVLLDDTDDIVGVVDWERAGWDDPLVDLAQLVQHVRWHAPDTVPALITAAGVVTQPEHDRLAVHVVLNAAAERAWVSTDQPANAPEALARLDALLTDLTA